MEWPSYYIKYECYQLQKVSYQFEVRCGKFGDALLSWSLGHQSAEPSVRRRGRMTSPHKVTASQYNNSDKHNLRLRRVNDNFPNSLEHSPFIF